jgi:integrase/recombinase XerD
MMRPDRGCLCLPVARWPDTDQQLWSAGLREGGLFDAVGAGAFWSAPSRRKTASGYGRWLRWLEATGQYDPALSPGRRVTRDRLIAYVEHLGETTSPYGLLSRVQELRDALRVVAPGDDLEWLTRLYRTMASRVRPVRDKRQRLRPVSDLATLGDRLMKSAETTAGWSSRRRAVQYRDGLMIALLAYRPVRVKNLAAMRLGAHVVEQHGRHWMLFSAAETKTRRAWQAMLPDALESNLRHYLRHHRPVLVAGEQGDLVSDIDALWVSEVGTQLETGALSTRIRKLTKTAFGQSIPPHWFRDAAATSIAIDNPVHVRDAHLILGHADMATTEKHYIQARSLQASRRHHAMLTDLLRRSPHSSGT